MATLGLGLLAGIVLAAGGITGLSKIEGNATRGFVDAQAIDYLGKLHDALGDARVEALSYIIAPNSARAAIMDGNSPLVPANIVSTDAEISHDASKFLSLTSLSKGGAVLRNQALQNEKLLNQGMQALGNWRNVRNNLVFTAANSGNTQQAISAAFGPLMSAYDAYSTPFDTLVSNESSLLKSELASARKTYTEMKDALLAIIIASCIVAPIFIVVLTRSLTKPLAKSASILEEVANGDLRSRIDHIASDEIGRMAQSLNKALDKIAQVIAYINQHADTLSSASVELSAVAKQMQSNASVTSKRAQSASAGAVEITSSTSNVASNTGQLLISVKDIGRNASEAAIFATSATSKVEAANTIVKQLDGSIETIGTIVSLISKIAGQTNLLALNATIEAARAQEAGKGFSVVAREVKELAKETAEATEQIGVIISQVQEQSRNVVLSIDQITDVITSIDEHQGSIASAVEEQAASTDEIARTVSVAAKAISDVSANVTDVAQAAEETTKGAVQIQTSAEELAKLAVELHEMSQVFTY